MSNDALFCRLTVVSCQHPKWKIKSKTQVALTGSLSKRQLARRSTIVLSKKIATVSERNGFFNRGPQAFAFKPVCDLVHDIFGGKLEFEKQNTR
ncbi:hypothetical protein AVEN_250867-1 [Araneus ventricosus]|uniref:Uncharacterized protein n=1 Tax=Araneus ventricosus TaxID=182803 RepID=A0A4Y2IMZ1_ARAVE|nr:hypothetical protein AVEN_250867-1 [Araneus ventricosus]